MRKLLSKTTALAVLTLTLAFGGAVNAEKITVDSSNFPEEAIRKELEKKADDDNVINTEDIDYLSIDDSVKSAAGLEKLTSLEKLYLYKYEGEDFTLDSSSLSSLTITSETVKSLTVNAPSVKILYVSGGNNLQTLDVSAEIALKKLKISGDVLTTVKGYDKLGKLDTLSVTGTLIDKVDAGEFPALESLYLSSMKKLASLDVSKLSFLDSLTVYETELKELDASACTELKNLTCQANKLTSIKVPNGVEEIYCSDNKLTSINIPSSAKYVECSRNKLTSIDVSKCKNLITLAVSDNKLKKINVKNNSKLNTLMINGNKNITSVDISKNKKLSFINVGCTGIKKLDTTKCGNKLSGIYCYNTKISSLNISKNKKLSSISYYGSKIKKLDLSKYSYMGAYYEAKRGAKINLKNFIGTGYKVGSKSKNVKYDSKTGVITVSKKAKKNYFEYVSLTKGKKTFWASILVTK